MPQVGPQGVLEEGCTHAKQGQDEDHREIDRASGHPRLPWRSLSASPPPPIDSRPSGTGTALNVPLPPNLAKPGWTKAVWPESGAVCYLK